MHVFTDKEITLVDGYYSVDEDGNGITDYGFADPKYNVSEWISNLVVRWEFLPGSTAFVVWAQTRDRYSPDGRIDFRNDLRDLFTGRKANNIFLIKFSYRIGAGR